MGVSRGARERASGRAGGDDLNIDLNSNGDDDLDADFDFDFDFDRDTDFDFDRDTDFDFDFDTDFDFDGDFDSDGDFNDAREDGLDLGPWCRSCGAPLPCSRVARALGFVNPSPGRRFGSGASPMGVTKPRPRAGGDERMAKEPHMIDSNLDRESCLMPFQRLDVYRCSKELVVIVHRAVIKDDELKDQARRASKSVFLHVAEGLPNYSLPMRRKYFIGARNSVCETSAAADAALAIACLDRPTALDIMQRSSNIAKMLSALMR